MTGESHSFQVNEIIVVLPGASLLASGTKTSKPAEKQVVKTRNRNFASG